ncbi:MAG: sugar transferase [Roseobacter sp.]|jgi:lipopolysaccharide/colanic/teichoic acid biosynthesis glycosyltransferase|nr:sugar transferase [Roseobacter sp.]
MTIQFSDMNIATDSQSEHLQGELQAQGSTSGGAYRAWGKRLLDIFLVIVAVPLTAPIIAILACIIAMRGGKPFYTQLRIGLNGERYKIWKLRTMIHNADRALEVYLSKNPAARLEWDATQKLKNDPRITPFGRLLRKTSLDELPQLWNVLNGSMSLVGPRPMMVEQETEYPGRSYYNLRPGITGLWQISDRNECNFSDRAKFDDAYDRDLSLKTDISTLVATVGVVLRGTGH